MFLRLVNLECHFGSCFLERGDLGALSLNGCKAYLRKHGLRLSGTKMVCIQRIKEHCGWCLPGWCSSFRKESLQEVWQTDRAWEVSGKDNYCWKGIVSDSYGAARQQHTSIVGLKNIIFGENLSWLWSTWWWIWQMLQGIKHLYWLEWLTLTTLRAIYE